METAGRKQARYRLADAGLPLGEMGAFAVTRISGVCKDLTTENGKAGPWTTGVHRGGEACGNWPRTDAGPLCPCSLSNGTVSLTPPSDRPFTGAFLSHGFQVFGVRFPALSLQRATKDQALLFLLMAGVFSWHRHYWLKTPEDSCHPPYWGMRWRFTSCERTAVDFPKTEDFSTQPCPGPDSAESLCARGFQSQILALLLLDQDRWPCACGRINRLLSDTTDKS